MPKSSEKSALLFCILAFSFVYRVLLMLKASYPPGADIGLHNSVMYSITSSGNSDFFRNFYQMGGGTSLTFPGFHIFSAFLISITGLPDFLAQSLIVCLFSTITVACSFLITRRVWGESTGLIVSFLVAVSRFDLEMLMWGGFPNVVTLMLIPLAFYLLLERERFEIVPSVLVMTLVSSAIYLAHSLSTVIFVAVTFVTAFFAFLLSKQMGISKKSLVYWILPLILGALILSPFLTDGASAYLRENAAKTQEIAEALYSTRILPLEIVVPLFGCVVFFFLFSREYTRKYLNLPVLLLTLWVLIPMFLTQGYLLRVPIDYNRFLYFVLMPVIMLIGIGIDHMAGFSARIAFWYQFFRTKSDQSMQNTGRAWLWLQRHMTPRNVYTSFALAFLLVAFLFVPIFMTPLQGVAVQSFYQVMTDPGYDAIKWARENTDSGSVFVSDALYGWWLGGFAQRPTLSAVDPQYLTLSRELPLAKNASYLLDTDYVIDNGLIQIREDGGYLARHNPMFLAKLNWSYFPYPFFNFDNDDTTLRVEDDFGEKSFTLSQLPIIETELENNPNHAQVTTKRGNSLLSFTQTVTVYTDRQFVNISISIDGLTEGISLKSLCSILHVRGALINRGNTVGLFEMGSKVLGQLIFTQDYPPEETRPITQENLSGLQIVYRFNNESSVQVQFFASAFSVSDSIELYENAAIDSNPYLIGLMDENVQSYLDSVQDTKGDFNLDFFDYRKALSNPELDISYVACRDSSVLRKFAADPLFSTVFINSEVSVFKVKSGLR